MIASGDSRDGRHRYRFRPSPGLSHLSARKATSMVSLGVNSRFSSRAMRLVSGTLSFERGNLMRDRKNSPVRSTENSASRRRFIGGTSALVAALLASSAAPGAGPAKEDAESLLKQAAAEEKLRLRAADTQKLCECWKGCRQLFVDLKSNKEVSKWLRVLIGLFISIVDGLCS
jgi:hypothetical protein